MEVQRCVWSCLYNSPGAGSTIYNQCVDRNCVTQPQPQLSAAPSAWRSGIASDGVHYFATTQAEQGMAFTYFCTLGQSYFVLADVPVPAGQYRLLIGGTDYIVTFDMSRGVLSTSIPASNLFMRAVRVGGDDLRIRSMQGAPVLIFSLRGADEEIGKAIAGCQS